MNIIGMILIQVILLLHPLSHLLIADFESPENGVGYTITYPNYDLEINISHDQEDLPSGKLLNV